MDLRINPNLDQAALHQSYLEQGRVQVLNFLEESSALALLAAVEGNQQWFMTFNDGDNNMECPLAQVQNLAPAQQRQLIDSIHRRATSEFQFCHIQYSMTESLQRGDNPGHPLHDFEHFINRESVLDWLRQLVADPLIRTADSMASLYAPGHFLTDHDDTLGTRAVAYTLQLTPAWNRNWGGHLVFYDDVGNITDGFLPSFNTLNLFRVPQSHAVQLVAPFASAYRRSITGWLNR